MKFEEVGGGESHKEDTVSVPAWAFRKEKLLMPFITKGRLFY